MPIANITLPDGTKITIEGKSQEVAGIIKRISQSSASKPPKTPSKAPKSVKARIQPKGPIGHISALKDDGYFKARRTLSEIQKKLEEKGYIYARTSLSPALVRLTRKHELRRIKSNEGWVYVS